MGPELIKYAVYYANEMSEDSFATAKDALANPTSWEKFKHLLCKMYPQHEVVHTPVALPASLPPSSVPSAPLPGPLLPTAAVLLAPNALQALLASHPWPVLPAGPVEQQSPASSVRAPMPLPISVPPVLLPAMPALLAPRSPSPPSASPTSPCVFAAPTSMLPDEAASWPQALTSASVLPMTPAPPPLPAPMRLVLPDAQPPKPMPPIAWPKPHAALPIPPAKLPKPIVLLPSPAATPTVAVLPPLPVPMPCVTPGSSAEQQPSLPLAQSMLPADRVVRPKMPPTCAPSLLPLACALLKPPVRSPLLLLPPMPPDLLPLALLVPAALPIPRPWLPQVCSPLPMPVPCAPVPLPCQAPAEPSWLLPVARSLPPAVPAVWPWSSTPVTAPLLPPPPMLPDPVP